VTVTVPVTGPRTAVRRRALAALTALAAAPLGGCVGPVPLDAPALAELPPPVPDWIGVRATEADDGARVELARGASLAVSLRVPGGAGIGWRERIVPSGLVRTGRFTGPVWPKDAPSSPVTPPPIWQVLVFEAREGPGGDLVLELDGETGTRPRRLSLRVLVPR
jgi:hypothetical protein